MKFPQGPGNRETEVLLPGERSSAEGRAVGNRILLALPEAEYQALRPLLSSVVLTHHASLHEPGDKIEFVYFPNAGLVSLVVAMKEGKTVEVGAVGNEGLVGTPAVVGLDRSPHRAIVQITGDGLGFRPKPCGAHYRRHPSFNSSPVGTPCSRECKPLSLRPATGCMELSSASRAGY